MSPQQERENKELLLRRAERAGDVKSIRLLLEIPTSDGELRATLICRMKKIDSILVTLLEQLECLRAELE